MENFFNLDFSGALQNCLICKNPRVYLYGLLMKKENKMPTIQYGFESRSGTSILYVPSFIIRILFRASHIKDCYKVSQIIRYLASALVLIRLVKNYRHSV